MLKLILQANGCECRILNFFTIRCHGRIAYYSSSQIDKEETRQSVSSSEMDQFRKLSSQWWKPGGKFEALRSMNKLRIPLIKKLLSSGTELLKEYPLKGYKVLDVGCGGGILSEPIARLGAEVVGIDPLQENIEAAKSHLSFQPELINLKYQCTLLEELCAKELFDLVVVSEVLEHVNEPRTFVAYCCSHVKPGGYILFTTINRTFIASLLAKYVAEYIFRIVPINTHDENKFVPPYELTGYLQNSGMYKPTYLGMSLNPLTMQWSWIPSTLVNYACHAQKPLS
ncbi:ubiquinone biosynthesis O-methyltransferase, mitochondrial [Hydra vulgaris]|uniref:ubiquinone biosynthesis O-methyltransferase, mitochondrial n=1 Tax=Hydra vulgaris TaxID=6087 RepID=UPI001F5F9D9F|nr:ubiquinone biosynthesis O-methyltransferase, mitochondrial [Hydra vulgaris]